MKRWWLLLALVAYWLLLLVCLDQAADAQMVGPPIGGAGAGIAGAAGGPWTPSLQFGGATTGITYTVQTGSYQQAGKIVLAQFTFTLSSIGTATGNATLCGIPVPATTAVQGFWVFEDLGGMANTTSALVGGFIGASTPAGCITLAQDQVANNPNANQLLQLTNANFLATANLQGSIFYLAQ
jgi:hypothetical protein